MCSVDDLFLPICILPYCYMTIPVLPIGGGGELLLLYFPFYFVIQSMPLLYDDSI